MVAFDIAARLDFDTRPLQTKSHPGPSIIREFREKTNAKMTSHLKKCPPLFTPDWGSKETCDAVPEYHPQMIAQANDDRRFG